jgi:hypothetical protein
LGTIAADRKEHIEIELFYGIDNFRSALAASPRSAKNGAANLMNIVHNIRVEFSRLKTIVG